MSSSYHRNRFLLLCGVIVALLWFWLVGKWFDIPSYRGFDMSLLRQPHPLVVVLVVIVAILVCTAVCTLIAGTVRSDAGLFCTALGLIALAMRGGAMRNVLLGAPGRGVYYVLCAEIVMLFGVMVPGIPARARDGGNGTEPAGGGFHHRRRSQWIRS
jgi:hypothetical protein